MTNFDRDSGEYVEVPKVPTPNVYYNDVNDEEDSGSAGKDAPHYASVHRESPVGNEAEESPPRGEDVDVIHESQLGNDNGAFEN